jgi:hypothetical protein
MMAPFSTPERKFLGREGKVMGVYGRSPWAGLQVLFTTLMVVGIYRPAQAQKDACNLVAGDELQTALGVKVSGLKPQAIPGKPAQICMGQTPTATVMLRLAKRSPNAPGHEVAGLEMARKMGAQVEVKPDGPITCSTVIPPVNLEQYGFNTTCSVFKNGQVAAIEVTAKSRANMVSTDVLHRIVQKIADRM